jgi:hypothetical protein
VSASWHRFRSSLAPADTGNGNGKQTTRLQRIVATNGNRIALVRDTVLFNPVL